MFDVLVAGAGPNGLATAMYAQERGLSVLVVERGTVAEHVTKFPNGMVFFGPRWSNELGNIPCDSLVSHPTREEAVSYFRRVAKLSGVHIETRTELTGISGSDGAFTAHTKKGTFFAKKIVLATGTFGWPKKLEIPGAELPKVRAGYRDPLEFCDSDVLIAGAGNGAAEAALRLHYEAGARVTVLNRRPELDPQKWRWKFGDLVTLLRAGKIRLINGGRLLRLDPHTADIQTPAGEERIANDHVVVIAGYKPDTRLFDSLGVKYDEACAPLIDPRTLETNVRGVYVAGVACAGSRADMVLIVSGRNHGRAIVAHILGEPAPIRAGRIEDREYWRQFEALGTPIDPKLAAKIIPVVAGELRDDVLDLYQLKTGGALDAPARLGEIVDELPPGMLQPLEDGGAIFKGRKISASAFETLRLVDGRRSIAEIAAKIAEIHELPEQEVEPSVTKLILSLLREGRLTWRAERLPE